MCPQTVKARRKGKVKMSNDKDLLKRIEALEHQVGMLEDVHAIRRLHHLCRQQPIRMIPMVRMN
jgi:hypothetical protein